jgi:hypothetical protein
VAEEKDSWGIDKYLRADPSATLKSKGRHLHDTHNALVETLLNDWELMIKKLPTSGFLRPAFGFKRGGLVLRPVGGFSELEKRVGCEREGLIQSVKKSKILIFHNLWRVDYYGAFKSKEPEVFKFCYVHTK